MPLWQIIAAAIAVFAVFLIVRSIAGGSTRRVVETDHRESRFPDLGEEGAVLKNLDPEVRDTILGHLHRNQKINAIKEMRSATGLGLKESKDIIDAISAKMDG